MTDTSRQTIPWWRLWGLSQSATASTIGILAAFFIKLSDRGFNGGVKAVGVTLLVLLLFLLGRALRNGKQAGWNLLGRRTLQRIALGMAWAPIWFPAFFISLFVVGWSIVPDLGPIYFQIRKSYIESHWQIDPQTGRRYFPIDYFQVRDGPDAGKFFPRNFFIVDDGSFRIVDWFSGISVFCGGSKYHAKKLSPDVYLLRAYVDDPAETLDPCLIMPSPKRTG